MYIEVGPTNIVITTKKNGELVDPERERLEDFLKAILKFLGENLPILKQKAYKIKRFKNMPSVTQRMIEAVKTVDEEGLTPMAAVAGAVSDEVKYFLKEEGFDFISVNNGGDISVLNENPQKKVKISIGDINKNKNTRYCLRIKGITEYGIATSGFGGRSFTLGIAEISTVIAKNGAIADAAATYVCNKTNVLSNSIVRELACRLDPLTDIPNEYVTVSIGDLNDFEIERALNNGLEAATLLKKNDVIYACLIYLKGKIVTTIDESIQNQLEVYDGNKKISYYN